MTLGTFLPGAASGREGVICQPWYSHGPGLPPAVLQRRNPFQPVVDGMSRPALPNPRTSFGKKRTTPDTVQHPGEEAESYHDTASCPWGFARLRAARTDAMRLVARISQRFAIPWWL